MLQLIAIVSKYTSWYFKIVYSHVCRRFYNAWSICIFANSSTECTLSILSGPEPCGSMLFIYSLTGWKLYCTGLAATKTANILVSIIVSTPCNHKALVVLVGNIVAEKRLSLVLQVMENDFKSDILT